jgi:hypothetical protein
LQDSGNPTKLVTLLIMRQSCALPCSVSPLPSLAVFSDTDSSTDDDASITTTHCHNHWAGLPAARTTMSQQTQTLAKVKVTKMKECLMLTARKIAPLIMQSWTLTCKRYIKHGSRMATDIVSYVAEGMFEPRLVVWYQADQTRIDALSLNEYLKELMLLVLEKNWVHDILKTILPSSQGTQVFMDWKIEIENLNAILTTSTPTKALTKAQLKAQLQSNLHPDLRLSLSLEPVLAPDLAAWAFEVKECDDHMQAKDERTQKLIDVSNTACAACQGKKKDLLSWLTDAPTTSSSSSPPVTAGKKTQKTERNQLPTLTGIERDLLKLHHGCTCCQQYNAGHTCHECPMTAGDTWPDAATYMLLTVPPVAAATQEHDEDNETDLYVPPTPEVPFTVPHIYTSLSVRGHS